MSTISNVIIPSAIPTVEPKTNVNPNKTEESAMMAQTSQKISSAVTEVIIPINVEPKKEEKGTLAKTCAKISRAMVRP